MEQIREMTRDYIEGIEAAYDNLGEGALKDALSDALANLEDAFNLTF